MSVDELGMSNEPFEDLSGLDLGDELEPAVVPEEEPTEEDPTEEDPTEEDPKEDEPKEDEPKEEDPAEEEPAEEDPKEEEPTEDEPAPIAENGKIPLSRFQKVIEQRNEMKKKLEVLEAQQGKDVEVPELDDLDEAEIEKMFNAQLDGDSKVAVGTFKQILAQVATKAAETGRKAALDEVAEKEATREQAEIETTLTTLHEVLPQLDAQSEHYDKKFDNLVYAEAMYLIENEGYTKTEALRVASEDLGKRFGYLAEEQAPKESKPKPEAPSKEAAIKRAVETANKQPPRTSTARNDDVDAKGIDIFDMSDEDFEKLTEAELAELRGDFG